MRQLISLWIACAVLLIAPFARANTWLRNYELDVSVDENFDAANYRVTFEYRAENEVKSRGFKFVGKSLVRSLRAVDDLGRPLSVVELPDSSGERKLDFEIPQTGDPDKPGRVTLMFHQDLNQEIGWNSMTYNIPWAHQFKISVTKMRVVLRTHAPIAFKDSEPDSDQSCVRETQDTEPVSFTRRRNSTVDWIVFLLALGGSLGMWFYYHRAAREKLLAEVGVLPPDDDVVFPETDNSSEVYRAPAPIKRPDPLVPLLPKSVAAAFKKTVNVSLAGWSLVFLFACLFATRLGTIAPQFTASVFALITAWLLARRLSTTEVPVWHIAFFAFAAFGLLIGSVFGLLLGLVPLVGKGLSMMPSIPSSGYSSGSSSSSSSCGGGGGGSSCGGGGSSCGGGGGGGGCGG